MNTLSQTSNKDLMAQAREALKGQWGLAIGANVIYCVIVLAAQNIPNTWGILGIIVGAPMMLGLAIFSISLARKQQAHFTQLFDGIKRFWISLGAYVVGLVFILLWSLLLIVPGIMAAYSYAMTFYILADNEEIGALEAITKSKEMMRGNRWKLCCLGLRFIGWFLVCALTLGIGFLWVLPYMYVAIAAFYDDIKPTAEEIAVTASGQQILC